MQLPMCMNHNKVLSLLIVSVSFLVTVNIKHTFHIVLRLPIIVSADANNSVDFLVVGQCIRIPLTI